MLGLGLGLPERLRQPELGGGAAPEAAQGVEWDVETNQQAHDVETNAPGWNVEGS